MPTESQDLINSKNIQVENPQEASFMDELLGRLPKPVASSFVSFYRQSRNQAEKIVDSHKDQLDGVLNDFVGGLESSRRQEAGKIIRTATIMAAVVGCSPIPFSDAILLVPIQLTMMARLHKLFGQSWTKSLGKSFTKELAVVGFGRSTVGNIMKLIPGLGTYSGAAVNGVVASSITASLGWATVKMLNGGEDLLENMGSFKGKYKGLMQALKKAGIL
ncbi:YcjF family protein [Vaginisenegalia massiliensis]|uniref:YcjF family protein n=1 Tax=Vaginisenegalia massiliensis TaxID=2058294 RepID=UPI000F549F78|nr:DUF697 domain-containing protein [Vaginisenegalia massiliensis]